MTTPVPEALPTAYEYGRVIGRFLRAVGDGEDVDAVPEAVPATGAVTFTPIITSRILIDASVEPSPLITHEPITCELDAYGHIARNGVRGVWLWTGEWTVSFNVSGMSRTPFPILVSTAHTDVAPLDLWEAAPYTPPAGTTVTTMMVPSNPTDGYVLKWSAASSSLVWGALADSASQPGHTHTLDDTTDTATRLALTPAERAKLTNTSGSNTGDQTLPTWATIADKPAVIAAGATQGDARTAIGAGTSSLVIGTGAGNAKAGNYTPPDATTTVKGLVQLTGDLRGTATAPTVVAASATVAGKVELATTAEATTGTDTVRAVTPAGVKAVADTKAATSHTHDDRYFTETEANARFAPAVQTINAQTGTSYTLVASDAGKLVTCTNSGAITVTVPASTFSAGQRVDMAVLGEGMVTLVGSGITLNTLAGLSLVSDTKFSAFTIYFLTATTAFVTGSMAADGGIT